MGALFRPKGVADACDTRIRAYWSMYTVSAERPSSKRYQFCVGTLAGCGPFVSFGRILGLNAEKMEPTAESVSK